MSPAIVLMAIAGFASLSQSADDQTLIHLSDGDVQGQLNDASREFLGIPFAAPPVGELRWRPPVPVTPWSGVVGATTFSPACPQQAGNSGTDSENEDCLYLNVWTPQATQTAPRAVMVWIHGGGNVTGSTGDGIPFPDYDGHFYDGHLLAEERNVVVVSLNYRLGVFGFFAHPDLASENLAYPYGGNQGLLDQVAALEWVRDNIAAFGGDPGNVTIFGESAGSIDVCVHQVSPLSRGLFHRAISQSGGCTTLQRTAAEGAATAQGFAAAEGCSGPDELGCLRALPAATVLADAQPLVATPGASQLGIVVDGGFLPDQPRTLFDSGEYAKVPYVLGFNSDEGTVFLLSTPPVTTEAEYVAALEAQLGVFAADVVAAYPAGDFASPQDALASVVGDAFLVCPTYDVARRSAAGRARTYLYNFARETPIPVAQVLGLGAFHGAEIPYVFGSISFTGPSDAGLGRRIREYWSRFAERGRPRARQAVGWPRYKDRSDRILRVNIQLNVVKGLRRDKCEMWWAYYDSQFVASATFR
ncbi:MAG: carboxylesterase family protein [Deltaproteobacteria bacterium]|nr:carboxylesterase family protein [Deltaproteobacteria bacterium]